MAYFKVSCEFYVEAEDEQQIQEEFAGDPDFYENHIMVDEVSKQTAEKEGIYR